MNKTLAAKWRLLVIAVLMVGGGALPAGSQGPEETLALERAQGPVLVKIDLLGGADLQHSEASGLAIYAHLTTQDEDYLIAGAAPDDLSSLAVQDLDYHLLDREFAPGEYYLVYPPTAGEATPRTDPRHSDQLSLISRHGKLLYFDGVRALIRAPAAQAEMLPTLGMEIQWLPDSPIRLAPNVEPKAYPSLEAPDPTIAEMMAQVSAATASMYDGNLSGENEVTIGGQPYTISTRYSYSGTPIQKATQFVHEHFENLGLQVAYHDYSWAGNNWRNVVATKPGITYPDDIYIVCAHLDSTSEWQYRYTDAPGADDNASGTTAVMIAADILSQYEFDYTIRFIAFTGEEQGLYGSYFYSWDASDDGDNIRGVLNLDMLGYNSDTYRSIDLHAGTMPGSIAIANLFSDVVDTYDIDLVPWIITSGATTASDHASFWNRGYSAILAIEDWSDHTPHYHTTDDQLSTLDIGYLTDFVRASVGTVATMSSPLSDWGSVAGTVTFWRDSVGVPDVALTLDGGQVYTDVSQADGSYIVSDVATGDYTLTPTKSSDVNGISAYDASLALQHEAGSITLSGYAATAGDVDKNGGITSVDASYILQKAAGLITLPFPGASAVWEFDPANRTYVDLSGSISRQDFTATLVGDVSGNWSQVGYSIEGPPSPAQPLHGGGTETPFQSGWTLGSGESVLLPGHSRATSTASLPNLYAEPGERITIALEIELNQVEVYGADIAVGYDPAVVSLASASAGDAAQDFVAESNLKQPGLARVAMASAQPITEGGHLLVLGFEVVGEPGDTSPLQIMAIALNEGGATAQPQDGSISVVSFPDHDFNRDCEVNMGDILEIASHWRLTSVDPGWDALYDLDGNGAITVVDIMMAATNWGATCW